MDQVTVRHSESLIRTCVMSYHLDFGDFSFGEFIIFLYLLGANILSGKNY